MKINKNLLSLLSLSAVAVTTITSVYAWYVSTIGIVQDISDNKLAANASYYQSGTGTNDDPYIIANARHLYNLAWLQDLGYYDDKVYYFKLANDIDMSTLKIGDNGQSPIPAIGIDDHPFIGSFDGQGYTINNLYVASNFSSSNCITPSRTILNSHNQEQTKKTYNTSTNNIISNYNGLFGVINKFSDSSTTASSSDSKVTNFTIANAKIESSQNTLVGYICGYVNSDLSNVGVANSNLTLASGVTHYSSYPISKYGLVGDYNNSDGGIEWEGGGDIGYGTSTDIRQLYYDLGGTDGTSSIEVTGKQALPFRPDTNDEEIKKATQTSANVNISESNTGKVNLASNQQAAKNNIGYYVGNSVKAFRDSSVKSLTITSPSSSYYNYFSSDVPEEVTKFLNKEVTDKTGNTSYNYQYSIFISDSTDTPLSSGYNNANNLYLVENAIVNNFTCGKYVDENSKLLLVPNRCIWVAPKEAGKFKLVVYNSESSTCQLAIYRLIRSTPKDYSTYFTSATKFLIKNGTEITGNDANITIPKSNSKTDLQAYYYTFDVTDSDVSSGYEFAITQNVGKPYIAYLDIGNNGSDSTSYIGTIKDIDFTYVSGTGYALVDTDKGFTLSNVYFNIDGTTTKEVALYVMRSIQSGNLVYYYFISDDGLTNTISGSPTDAKTKEDFDKLS